MLLLAELPSAPLPTHTAVRCLAEGVKGRHSFALRVFRVSSGCKGRKSVEIWDSVSEKRWGEQDVWGKGSGAAAGLGSQKEAGNAGAARPGLLLLQRWEPRAP